MKVTSIRQCHFSDYHELISNLPKTYPIIYYNVPNLCHIGKKAGKTRRIYRPDFTLNNRWIFHAKNLEFFFFVIL